MIRICNFANLRIDEEEIEKIYHSTLKSCDLPEPKDHEHKIKIIIECIAHYNKVREILTSPLKMSFNEQSVLSVVESVSRIPSA